MLKTTSDDSSYQRRRTAHRSRAQSAPSHAEPSGAGVRRELALKNRGQARVVSMNAVFLPLTLLCQGREVGKHLESREDRPGLFSASRASVRGALSGSGFGALRLRLPLCRWTSNSLLWSGAVKLSLDFFTSSPLAYPSHIVSVSRYMAYRFAMAKRQDSPRCVQREHSRAHRTER
jgi:hypothetical protein